MSRLTRSAHTILFTIAVSVVPLLSQTGSGVVQGTVTDPASGAVPNAKVFLRNTGTGVAKSGFSNSVGVFYLGAVQPGPYELVVEAPGFKRWTGTFGVEVGQTVTIDPNMEIGTLGAVVEVTGAAPVIETEGMQIADVKDSLRIQTAPAEWALHYEPVRPYSGCRRRSESARQRT